MTKWVDQPHWEFDVPLPRQRRARRLAGHPGRDRDVPTRRDVRGTDRAGRPGPAAGSGRRARLAGDVPRRGRTGARVRRHHHSRRSGTAPWCARSTSTSTWCAATPAGCGSTTRTSSPTTGSGSATPTPLVAAAAASCDRVHAAVAAGAAPYDGSAARSAELRAGCGTLSACASTSTGPPSRRWASSGSSRWSTAAPATCATTRPTCSRAPSPGCADPNKLHKELLRNTVEIVSGVCRTVERGDDRRAPHARGRGPGR